jgi:serine/threonine protein kinase
MHNKGIMHRDIKPSNILFRKSPPTKAYILEHDSSASIVLSDFGISTRKELAFDEAGTSGYMGPEVYHDNRKPDEGYNY